MSRGLGSGSNPNAFSRFGSGSGLQEFHIPGWVRVRVYKYTLVLVQVRVRVRKNFKFRVRVYDFSLFWVRVQV